MSDFASVAAHLANTNRKNFQAHEAPPSPQARSAASPARPKPVHVQSPTRKPDSLSTASSKAALAAHSRQATSQSNSSLTRSAPPDSPSANDKALRAATASFRANSRIISIAPEMLTEHPPLRMEREEKAHKAALHASAVSLAKQAYAIGQARSLASTASGATSAAQIASAQSKHKAETPGIDQKPVQYLTLQDAAQRMANERLAKIGNGDKNAAFRDYYGYEPQRSRSQRLASRARGARKRSDSDPEDLAQSHRIRTQMTLLQAQIAQVDASKQAQDRQRVLEVARKRVQADMSRIDEAVFKDTGKMSPAMMQEWDERARSRLQLKEEQEQELRQVKSDDAVDIGGGRRMDRFQIDNLAASRVKPTLESINEAVAKKRAEEEAARARAEEKKRTELQEKEHRREVKMEQKRIHDEEKAIKKQAHDIEKAEIKRIHDEEKAERKRRKEETKVGNAAGKAPAAGGVQLRPESVASDSGSEKFSTPRGSVDVVRAAIESGPPVAVVETSTRLSPKKQPVWKRWSLHRGKPAETVEESSPGLFRRFLLGRRSVDGDKQKNPEVISPETIVATQTIVATPQPLTPRRHGGS
jgi:hypothetical protein